MASDGGARATSGGGVKAYHATSAKERLQGEEKDLLARLLMGAGGGTLKLCEGRAEGYLEGSGGLAVMLADPGRIEGLSAKEHKLLATVAEVARRYQPEAVDDRAPINGPADVVAHMAEIRAATQEHLVVLYLDARNRVMEKRLVSVGGLRASVISPKEILGPALVNEAASIAISHNHPSGNTKPSAEDMEVTRLLGQGCRTLGLELLDHVIVGKRGYTSLKELGAL